MAEPILEYCGAAVVMSHNLQIDAAGIRVLQSSSVKYLALLGPLVRQRRVLALAELTHDTLRIPLAGPAGLDLGAELPEGLALSILAECHGVLQQASGLSLSSALADFSDNRRFL